MSFCERRSGFLADVRASPRYQDLLILIETRPNRTMNAPRMLSDTFRSLTSRVGISDGNCAGIMERLYAGGRGLVMLRPSFAVPLD